MTNHHFHLFLALVASLHHGQQVVAFHSLVVPSPVTASSSSPLFMATSAKPLKPRRKGYEPKWKKKATLAEQTGGSTGDDLTKIGLKGDIPVLFKQGNQTKTTTAFAGQPLRDVATQAGQFIKYGCGKGECGTCEALVNGQWIRPCCSNVPPLPKGEEYLVQVKEVKAKTVSSGKFYSARSFVLGFWNNLLGMVGFVKARRLARKNWEERQEYEELIRIKTLEKKRARALREGKTSEDLDQLRP